MKHSEKIIFLRNVWYYYKEHKNQYWDMMSDIEDRIAELYYAQNKSAISSIDVNQQLSRDYQLGTRSTYAKGKLPADWVEKLYDDDDDVQ